MYEKLQVNRDKYTSGTENEGFSNLLKEANDIRDLLPSWYTSVKMCF